MAVLLSIDEAFMRQRSDLAERKTKQLAMMTATSLKILSPELQLMTYFVEVERK
jgi:hypothetical protein